MRCSATVLPRAADAVTAPALTASLACATTVQPAVCRLSSAVTAGAACSTVEQQCCCPSQFTVLWRGLQVRRGACTTQAGALARRVLHLQGPARRRAAPQATAERTAAATATPLPAAQALARRARAPAGPTSATSSGSTTGMVRAAVWAARWAARRSSSWSPCLTAAKHASSARRHPLPRPNAFFGRQASRKGLHWAGMLYV